jgi:hypothetical protein
MGRDYMVVMLKPGDVVTYTDASGGIVGWPTLGMTYEVERVSGTYCKLVGCEYSHKLWRFKLKEKQI